MTDFEAHSQTRKRGPLGRWMAGAAAIMGMLPHNKHSTLQRLERLLVRRSLVDRYDRFLSGPEWPRLIRAPDWAIVSDYRQARQEGFESEADLLLWKYRQGRADQPSVGDEVAKQRQEAAGPRG